MAPVYKACIIIPVYNHGSTLAGVIKSLPPLPVFVVDDGNGPETAALIRQAVGAASNAQLVTREKNGGKGAAFFDALTLAHNQGYSHALLVDADGQQDAGSALFFLSESKKHPEALICPRPCFDESAPALRSGGRKISTLWAHIVTLTDDIPDVLCGFRVYPVEKTLPLMRHVDRRMGFDPEILVRLYWVGVPLLFYPLKVAYPADGVSNFRYVRDNVRISWMWARLFFGMLPCLPALLRLRKLPQQRPPFGIVRGQKA
jgi:glycosyltransferase involved in cell wall biosynthesis